MRAAGSGQEEALVARQTWTSFWKEDSMSHAMWKHSRRQWTLGSERYTGQTEVHAGSSQEVSTVRRGRREKLGLYTTEKSQVGDSVW